MKSSSQLQRQAELTRQGLSDSLDGLRHAVTPSHVTTEVLNLAKDSSLSIAKALAEQARANPIPALLIGAGLVMLLTRSANGASNGADRGPDPFDKAGSALKSAATAGVDAARGTADAVRGTADGVQRTAADMASRAGDVASGLAQTIGSVAETVGSTARDTIGKAGEAASSLLDSARDTTGQVQDRASSTASELMQSALVQQGQQTAKQLAGRARQLSGNARNYVSTMAAEQPIMVAALGAALGAAIGVALPMTAAEQQYLGTTGARVKQAGRDAISKVADVVKSETVGDDLGAKGREAAI